MPDDPKPNALALDLMQRATLAQLRDDASELARLVRETLDPFPVLPPLDAAEREVMLTVSLLEARDRARRLLALITKGDVRFL